MDDLRCKLGFNLLWQCFNEEVHLVFLDACYEVVVVVCCLLFVVVVCCLLFVVCCLLFVVCCLLFVVCCLLLLFVVCCLLFVVCCLLFVATVKCEIECCCCCFVDCESKSATMRSSCNFSAISSSPFELLLCSIHLNYVLFNLRSQNWAKLLNYNLIIIIIIIIIFIILRKQRHI